MNYVPYNPLDDYKKQMEEMQERAREQIEKLNQESAFEDGESPMDYMKRMENNFKDIIPSLEKIANNSMEQAESIKSIADSASNQADSAKLLAEKANEDSFKAKKKVNWSIIIATISCIGTLIANADKIWQNIQKILSYLNMLK